MESWILWVSCEVIYFARDPKQDSMNLPKIELIAYIYILLNN